MAIYIDTPQRYQKPGLMRGRPFTSSHLISDRIGVEGLKELLDFARKIGQKQEWLQKPNDPVYVHFDVMNSRYAVAVKAGAIEVAQKEMARIWQQKMITLRQVNPTGVRGQ